jgi:hypothetical protein
MPEKAITSAISSTWAARPKIVVAPMASVCSADCTAVYTGPGAMVLTRTPAGLCSAAQERVNEASDEGADLGGVAQIGGHETGLTALGADLLDDGGPPGRIPASFIAAARPIPGVAPETRATGTADAASSVLCAPLVVSKPYAPEMDAPACDGGGCHRQLR